MAAPSPFGPLRDAPVFDQFRDPLKLVQAEAVRAVDLHGPLPTDHFRALGILMEEVGETAEAILDYTRGDLVDGGAVRRKQLQHLEDELVQVAAVAMRWLANIERMK